MKGMKDMKKYDAVIIGFGKGGKTLGAKLAGMGKSVAMVEKSDKMYGGTCINVGCIPSKFLVRSAASSAAAGGGFGEAAERYREAIVKKRALTAALRQKNLEKLLSSGNAEVINGTAAFTGPRTVSVKTGEGTVEIEGGDIYINTGSVSVHPRIEGIEDSPRVYYSDTMMELEELPQRLTIIGGGYIGLEFASMYANFGSKVTVLQDGDVFVPREDDDIAGAMKEVLERQGVSIVMGADIRSVSPEGDVKYLQSGREHVIGSDAVLAATGRRPNTDGLGLEKAGVETDKRGGIVTDEKMRTSTEHIWAMGDVRGGLQFTYVSLDDYRVIASLIDGGDYTLDKRKNIPYSVFLDTPFGRVGLNEKEAAARGIPYRVVKLPAMAIPKAKVLGRPEGVLKALISTETGAILGAMLLCQESFEMINTVKLAMDLGADYTVLRDQVFTHPTMSEALNDLFSIK